MKCALCPQMVFLHALFPKRKIREIEERLLSSPSVRQVAVIPLPKRKGMRALVYPDPKEVERNGMAEVCGLISSMVEKENRTLERKIKVISISDFPLPVTKKGKVRRYKAISLYKK